MTELITFLVKLLDNLKAEDIRIFDVKQRSDITDFMVVCHGTSTRHVGSIADNLIRHSKAKEIEVFGVEGKNHSDWIVVDFGTVMVHILQAQSRDLYQLETLWEK